MIRNTYQSIIYVTLCSEKYLQMLINLLQYLTPDGLQVDEIIREVLEEGMRINIDMYIYTNMHANIHIYNVYLSMHVYNIYIYMYEIIREVLEEDMYVYMIIYVFIYIYMYLYMDEIIREVLEEGIYVYMLIYTY
jgi:hypothetical protein